uniref:Nucleic acid binding, OB-fold, tRNA/helicase-type n=1 Tax=Cereibacter sphaeroides (strain ATCC 17025 / ATH 2.4.3) TaxID=349102 RepID=A4WR30_CERS5
MFPNSPPPPRWLGLTPTPQSWPRPPRAVPAARLDEPPSGARVAVAGLVLVRQRPGTARGVIFLTLEDETGVVNVVVRAGIYERFRREVVAGRLLRVTGRLQREGKVVHVVAEEIEDLSHLLDSLLHDEACTLPPPHDEPAERPPHDLEARVAADPARVGDGLPRAA